jgi:hypothetical protein
MFVAVLCSVTVAGIESAKFVREPLCLHGISGNQNLN